jgi:hypothetical protein
MRFPVNAERNPSAPIYVASRISWHARGSPVGTTRSTRRSISASATSPSNGETARLSPDALIGTSDLLGEQEIDLLVRAMSHNQANSDTCLGCRQTGHTLTDCTRFVDYIVAKSLAQRHPQLKSQVAASHSQFRSRLNIRNADGSPPTNARTVRRILSRSFTDNVDVVDQQSYATNETSIIDDEEDVSPDEYQLNALRSSFPASSDDFELCFMDADIRSCVISIDSLPLFESVCGETIPFCHALDIPAINSESFLFRRFGTR